MTDHTAPNLTPFNRLSPYVWVFVAIMLLVELVLQLAENHLVGQVGSEGWRLWMAQNFGFHKAVFEHIMQGGKIEPKVIWPFFTYPFVSRSLMHMIVPTALILGMGKMISDNWSNRAFFALFFVSTVAGAFVFGWLSDPGRQVLLGAYPFFYCLLGAMAWNDLMLRLLEGRNPLGAFRIVGMFFVLRAAFALIYGLNNSWMADLTGLLVGLTLPFVVAPGSRARFRRWVMAIRNR